MEDIAVVAVDKVRDGGIKAFLVEALDEKDGTVFQRMLRKS
jgi:hypothetical protein